MSYQSGIENYHCYLFNAQTKLDENAIYEALHLWLSAFLSHGVATGVNFEEMYSSDDFDPKVYPYIVDPITNKVVASKSYEFSVFSPFIDLNLEANVRIDDSLRELVKYYVDNFPWSKHSNDWIYLVYSLDPKYTHMGCSVNLMDGELSNFGAFIRLAHGIPSLAPLLGVKPFNVIELPNNDEPEPL